MIPGKKSIAAYAPGKLILSGEHSVVYGKPAIAMAVNRYAKATLSAQAKAQILFDLTDFAHQGRLTIDALNRLKTKIKKKYERFKTGEFSIREVLQKPFELAQFAMGLFAESQDLRLPGGVKLHLHSSIPIGCGMGSSAATILAVMHAVSTYMNTPISPDVLFKLALEAENAQHGRSSGLDLRVAMQGGCVYMLGDQIESRPLPGFNFYLINTGTPTCSTGQCVEAAASFFQSSMTIADDFGAVTQGIDEQLSQTTDAEIYKLIRENHKLLTKIGVVPQKVQTFIQEIEMQQGSAKICGAGAVSGESAGIILVLIDDPNLLSRMCRRYNYEILSIIGETRGLHVI